MTVLYSTSLHFNTIYVIESLPPGELRSGRELYDSILMPAIHANEGLLAEFHELRTSADLRPAPRPGRTGPVLRSGCPTPEPPDHD